MNPDVYVIKNNTRMFGNEKIIFAFRKAVDAQVVKHAYKVLEQRVLSQSKKIHLFRKTKDARSPDLDGLCLVQYDIDTLCYNANLHGLDLEIVSNIVENDNRILMVSNSAISSQDVTFIDRKLRIEELFEDY